ncbi:TRAP transporter substrate-binding protein DctP [Hoeflea sp. WL0058]|uniref:TRAP transporter substrate-binding protein DctP n=1 Tax=Flavimaribacter sediminis TaxID=2865987 RepID=A0AAE2ZIU8_9HYPH|nr:TRAP transporter substrate-binding protein DctP [Flavimaribacter sediminis]MBW8637293.1 TRAP transporter substrate-binding protein DctP [Flavimaribacter sediminis]
MRKLSHIIGVTLAVSMAVGTAAAEPVVLKWAGPAPADDSQVLAIELMGEYLERTAPGEFEIEVYPAGTLVKQSGVLPSLQTGAIQLAYVNAFDVGSQLPEYGPLTAAYSVRDPLHMCSVLNGEIGAEFGQALEEKVGLVPLGATLFGMRHVGLREAADVDTPEDLSGVKQREPASEAWQMQGRSLGANPTPMALGELFLGLQTGAVDAHSLPIPSSYRLKLHEVTDQIVLTNHYVNHLILVVGKPTWDQLDDRQKTLLREAADVARIYNDRKKVRDETELRAVFEEAGVTFTEPDIEAFRAYAAKVYAESDFAKNWQEGLAERIAATPSDNPACFHLMP